MQHREGIRKKMGRVGACLALASSILVFAGPAAATAEVAATDEPGRDRFFVHLSGDQIQDGGDRGGRGAAGLDFDPEHEKACYVVAWKDLRGAVTDLHLHVAKRHSDGPHWIDFFNDQHYDGEQSTVSGCVQASRQQIYAVIHHPSDFYLNVHTTAHKGGAIRGQLS